mgnify:CR=1 FL=1
MPKYRIYEIATAAYFVGEYEAETKDEAEAMADSDPQNEQPCLCHYCAGEVDLGEFYKYQTDEIRDVTP